MILKINHPLVPNMIREWIQEHKIISLEFSHLILDQEINPKQSFIGTFDFAKKNYYEKIPKMKIPANL